MPPYWGKNLKNSANLKSKRDSELNMVLHPVALSLKKPAAMYLFDDSVIRWLCDQLQQPNDWVAEH